MTSIPASAPTPGMVNVPEASNQVSHDAVFWGTALTKLESRRAATATKRTNPVCELLILASDIFTDQSSGVKRVYTQTDLIKRFLRGNLCALPYYQAYLAPIELKRPKPREIWRSGLEHISHGPFHDRRVGIAYYPLSITTSVKRDAENVSPERPPTAGLLHNSSSNSLPWPQINDALRHGSGGA